MSGCVWQARNFRRPLASLTNKPAKKRRSMVTKFPSRIAKTIPSFRIKNECRRSETRLSEKPLRPKQMEAKLMTNQMLDMEFVKRLERLESENRKLKRIGTVILAVGCILFLSAQTAPKNQTVEAEKFVLRDAGGKVRGRLSADSKKTLLELFNAEG